MILIDTSAWIASFKKIGNHELKEFMKQAIVSGLAVTSPIIILELPRVVGLLENEMR